LIFYERVFSVTLAYFIARRSVAFSVREGHSSQSSIMPQNSTQDYSAAIARAGLK
jgi:hypothetical protein